MPISIREYLAIGKLVALLGAVALICWQSSQIHSWHLQANASQAKLDGISTKRNEQKIVTRDRIVTVIKTLKSADERAKVVEAAPLPGQCKSPPEVMGADL